MALAALDRPDPGRLRADAPVELTHAHRTMGGMLTLRLAVPPGSTATAERSLRQVAGRVDAWAAHLTRYSDRSDLAALNRRPDASREPVRPTLAAVLAWAARAEEETGGLVDVTLLDARLTAEPGADADADPAMLLPAAWRLERHGRGAVVERQAPCRFDLDGVAKGWIADRALALLRRYPAALVDADGDLAVRLERGRTWEIAVADPRRPGTDLAILSLDDRLPGGRAGVATSGTSIHRWPDGPDGSPRHHLIDPRTGRPARTDLVQVTVLAGDAARAEVLAKAALIVGSGDAIDLLERSGAHAALLLRTDGELLATRGSLGWLA